MTTNPAHSEQLLTDLARARAQFQQQTIKSIIADKRVMEWQIERNVEFKELLEKDEKK